jgi:AcrR family transcriptional regulator
VRAGTPRGELTRIRESRERQDEGIRERILDAMLEASGEKGYRNVAVQDVIDRYGGNRVQFYRHFASKDDCYAEAYRSGIDRFSRRLLEACGAASGWRLGLRATLGELAGFIEEQPLVSRGLLIEVHVAGGKALEIRAEVWERLTGAIDGARAETGPHPSPPPVTARFMLGAIETSVTTALAAGEPAAFADSVPELAHMIVSTYLGEDAAEEELAALSAA